MNEGDNTSATPPPPWGSASTMATSATLEDNRGVARGWGRIVVVAFWVAGVGVTALGVYQLFRDVDAPVGPRLVTVLAGLVYVGAAVGLTHNGRRMRKVAWACTTVAFAGPIIVGLLGLGVPAGSHPWSPWAQFGVQTYFISLVLPLVGMVWLWWSNPRRIVEIAEGLERASRREVKKGS